MINRIYRYFSIILMLAVFSVLLQPRQATAVYTIKVFEKAFCDSYGNKCSTATESGLQSQLDTANEIMERSKLPFRFVMHPDTDLTSPGNNSFINYSCIPPDEYLYGHPDCTGTCSITTSQTCNADADCPMGQTCNDPCVDVNGDGLKDGIIPQDLDGDGNVENDDDDENIVCIPNDQFYSQLLSSGNQYQNLYPDTVILLSPGYSKRARWNGKLGFWELIWVGGESGCFLPYIKMASNGGSGNFFAHEVGHYFCLNHPFYSVDDDDRTPATVEEAADMIKNYVQSNGIDRYNHDEVLRYFDGDYQYVFDADDDGDLDQLYVLDTPPDPAGDLLGLVNGGTCSVTNTTSCFEDADCPGGEKCKYDKCGPVGSVQVPVTYDDAEEVTYVLSPDRRLVMSYYKDCNNFDNIYSEDQAELITTVLFADRYALIHSQVQGMVWADFGYGGSEEWGTYYHPFNTLTEGINAVPEGNKLMIKKGTTSATPTISKEMVIDAFMGTVVIGR